jgi:hypothetical protein
VVSFVAYIIDSFITNNLLSIFLVDFPLLTIYKLHLWRIFFCFIVPQGFLSLILCLWMIYSDIIRIEKSIGSMHLFLELFLKSALIQVLFVFLALIFSFIFDQGMLKFPSQGLFPIIMLMITLRSLA